MNKDAISWFEIAVRDLDRSRAFYERILGTELIPGGNDDCRMAMFPCDEAHGVGGALARMDGCEPGVGGTLVYLNVEGDLDGVLARIPVAGGKVRQARLEIAPHGFIGLFEDPEGNIVGLHSMS